MAQRLGSSGNKPKRTNGSGAPIVRGEDRELRAAAIRAAASALVERAEFALSFEGSRDLKAALGYQKELKPKDYRARYERGDIAKRIVEFFPNETWGDGVAVVEDPAPGTETKLEEGLRLLDERLSIWRRLWRADILAGLGEYAILLIGADGTLDSELPRLGSVDNVLYLTALPEGRAPIDKLVDDPLDPRFGLPLTYKVKLSEKIDATVHWSRVIHIAENTLEDDIYGCPRLRPIWNRLDDLDKIVGGGAEATWRRVDQGLQIDIDPTIEMSEDEQSAVEDQVDEYVHNMRRVLQTRGTTVTPLSSMVPSFGPNADKVLDLISGATNIPKRILLGSERGELASTQDRSNLADAVAARRSKFAEPIIRDFIARLTLYGALPEAPDGYSIQWAEEEELTEAEKASVASSIADANAKQKAAGDTVIMTSDEIRDSILGLDPLGDVIDLDQPDDADPNADDQGTQQPDGDQPADDAGTPMAARGAVELATLGEPDWRLVQRAADKHAGELTAAISGAWRAAWSEMDVTSFDLAIRSKNADIPITAASRAVEASFRKRLPDITGVLERAAMSAATAQLRAARRRGSWVEKRRAADVADVELLRGAIDKFDLDFKTVNKYAVDWATIEGAHLLKDIAFIDAADVAMMRKMIRRAMLGELTAAQLASRIRLYAPLRSDQVQFIVRALERAAAARPGDVVRLGGKDYTVPRNGFAKKHIDAIERRLTARGLQQRAELIARTEINRSANRGQWSTWVAARDQGLIPQGQKREWIATPDDRVRPAHLAMMGQVRSLDEPFTRPDNGKKIEPGQEPNCRCAQALVTDDAAPAVPSIAKPPVQQAPPQQIKRRLTPKEILSSGEEKSRKQLSVSINPVLKLKVQSPGMPAEYGYWKGEEVGNAWADKLLRQAGGTQLDRELIAREIDELFKTNLVPDVAVRVVDGRRGSIMREVKGKSYFESSYETKLAVDPEQNFDLWMLDAVIGNGDRHGGNALLEKLAGGNTRIHAIDNGFCFLKKGIRQEVAWAPYGAPDWPWRPEPEQIYAWIARLEDGALQDIINRSPFTTEVKQAARNRIRSLLRWLKGPMDRPPLLST